MEEDWRLQSDPTFAFVQSTGVSSSSQLLDHLWLQNSSSSFNGSMVSFEELHDRETRGVSLFQSLIRASNGEDEGEDAIIQPEKKKRLTAKQVLSLERSFEADNKLEPDRKMQLANDLGLQPRQVAIWFQNRRARYKTKQLEKDYDALRSRYTALKADHDNLLREKERLKNEVLQLTDKLRRNSEEPNSGKGESSHVVDSEEDDDLNQSMLPSPYFPTIDSLSSQDQAFFWPY